MATENNKSKANKRSRQRYLPHNRPVRKALRPGVQGFYITCDGGRERQASHEAVNVIDSFYEELVHGTQTKEDDTKPVKQSLNKKIVFNYSDSSSSDEEAEEESEDNANGGDQKDANHSQTSEDKKEKAASDGSVKNNDGKDDTEKAGDDGSGCPTNGTSGSEKEDNASCQQQVQGKIQDKEEQTESLENQKDEVVEPPAKKQCLETVKPAPMATTSIKKEEKSVDRLIEAELAELGDKSKRRFSYLDSGCNGVIFIQMRVRDGDPSPKDIVQHMVSSLASTKKHVSRFMLRILPIEATCYASDEEIGRTIKPLIEKYFPSETESPLKFAVLYEARANTGIDRSKIIDTVAKSVPQPHKVDLSNPELHIVVQIVKTVCLLGVVGKYKEWAKYNVRQLTSSK
nr:THUMP domain-containing protein 1 homolog [Ipomoea trifida]GMD23052.1 THUMP domain-containing protein 1 homolog [Ipomoea batatas]